MSDWCILAIGFSAQILFSLRLIIQWLSSERENTVVVPKAFWMFSLTGSILLLIYGFFRVDFAIILGQILTYYIYIRNLQLQGVWKNISEFLKICIVVFPLLLMIILLQSMDRNTLRFFSKENITISLLILGIIGHVLFVLRFIYQWLYSESKKTSKLPIGFWYISSIGAMLILIYGVLRSDIVLISAHSFGLFIYFRNIYLSKET